MAEVESRVLLSHCLGCKGADCFKRVHEHVYSFTWSSSTDWIGRGDYVTLNFGELRLPERFEPRKVLSLPLFRRLRSAKHSRRSRL